MLVLVALLVKFDLIGSLSNITGEFINWIAYDAFRGKKNKPTPPPKKEIIKSIPPWTRRDNWPKRK